MADHNDEQARIRKAVMALPYGAMAHGWHPNGPVTVGEVADFLTEYGKVVAYYAEVAQQRENALDQATSDIEALRRILGDHQYRPSIPN